MKLRVVLFAGIVALAAFAACNTGGSNNTPAAPCTIPATSFAVVYPAPNASAVPDAIQQIIVAVNSPLPASWNAVIQYPSGGVVQTAVGAPVATVNPPFPTPNATPSFANPVYQSSSFPTNPVVPSGATVTVFLNDLGSNCTPTSVSTYTAQ